MAGGPLGAAHVGAQGAPAGGGAEEHGGRGVGWGVGWGEGGGEGGGELHFAPPKKPGFLIRLPNVNTITHVVVSIMASCCGCENDFATMRRVNVDFPDPAMALGSGAIQDRECR